MRIFICLLTIWSTQALATPWFVDATIKSSTAAMDLGVSNVTSWTQIPGVGDGTLTATSGSSTVWVGCSGTNDASGSTCSSGNEEVAISFTPPDTSFYEVCVDASFETGVGGTSTGGHLILATQIVQTGNTDHTAASTSGPVREFAPARVATGDNKMYNEHVVQTCRVFEFSANDRVTTRLFYKQKVSQNVQFSEVLLGGSYDNTSDNSIHWKVRALK